MRDGEHSGRDRQTFFWVFAVFIRKRQLDLVIRDALTKAMPAWL